MELMMEELREEQREIAEVIGLDSYLQLTKKFGGTSIYIAKAEEILNRKNRDEKIRNEFNGCNYAQLAGKYGLTEVWIRTIVLEKAKEIRAKPIDGQMSLLDYLNPEEKE